MLLSGKCEGKYREVIYCCSLTVAESAGTLQLILNLKRQFYHKGMTSISATDHSGQIDIGADRKQALKQT